MPVGRKTQTARSKASSTKLKVTVCEFQDRPRDFVRDWARLVAHLKREESDLLLLPEMPFHPWFAGKKRFVEREWQAVVEAHDRWQTRFDETAPTRVLGSRPVSGEGRRWNEGYLWEMHSGYRAVHQKYYLPQEQDFWEASWYQRGNGEFLPTDTDGVRIGFMICTDLWFMQHARAYGRAGTDLIVNPRATSKTSIEKWLTGGRTAAVVSGAFVLSSNRRSAEGDPTNFGGTGWVIDPDGRVLGRTSRRQPFLTVEIDLSSARLAKKTYPRYVLE